MLKDQGEILMRISEGDERAYAVFFDHYYSKLRPFVIRFTKSEPDTEEVLQETFVRVWLYRDRIMEIENADAWVYKVASRECLSFLRRTLSDRSSLTDISEEQDFTDRRPQTPLEVLDLDELRLMVNKAIDAMPIQRKKIYKLSREEGLKPADIAEKLGLSVSTVKNVLSTAVNPGRPFALIVEIIPGSPDLQTNLMVIILKILLRIGIRPTDLDDDGGKR